jgi:hypothetical protein
MDDIAGATSLIKLAGIGIVGFIAWFIAQRGQKQQIDKMGANFTMLLRVQSEREEQMLKTERELWIKILDEQSRREERNFALLQQMLDRMDYHSGTLSRLEQKIDTKWSCPIIKGGIPQ